MVLQYTRHCDSVFISHTCWELYKVPIIDPATLQVHFPTWLLCKLSVSSLLPVDSWRLQGLLLALAEYMTKLAVGISINCPGKRFAWMTCRPCSQLSQYWPLMHLHIQGLQTAWSTPFPSPSPSTWHRLTLLLKSAMTYFAVSSARYAQPTCPTCTSA